MSFGQCWFIFSKEQVYTGYNNILLLYVPKKQHAVKPEANHLEACNFPYTFETMLRIIPDQWKITFQFLPI